MTLSLVSSFLLCFILPVASSLSMKAEWIALKDAPTVKPRRSGHVAFTAKDRLLLFGGYAEDDDMKRYVTNDLWEWKNSGWTELAQSGQVPGPRLVSTAVVLNDSPFLLGGWDPQTEGTGGVILDTIHKLDVESGEWTKLSTVLPDGPTSRHVALSFDKSKAFIHNHRCTDHVWVFDSSAFTKQTTTGMAPSSRGLHCATMLTDHVAILFGGAAQNGVMSNEVFLLDTETWKWTPVEIKSEACPSPRAGASLCCYKDDCAILFGGAEQTPDGLNPKGDVWALHVDVESGTGEWELLSDSGPEPRNAATLTPIDPIDDKDGKCFLLTGGWAPFRQTWNDCNVLRISE